MIFSSKINKLAGGANVSFFPISVEKTEMYVFNDLTSKKNISFLGSNFVRCKDAGVKFSYNKLMRINGSFLAVCYDKNISVIQN